MVGMKKVRFVNVSRSGQLLTAVTEDQDDSNSTASNRRQGVVCILYTMAKSLSTSLRCCHAGRKSAVTTSVSGERLVHSIGQGMRLVYRSGALGI
jgi:hypothetical protein